MLQFAFQQSAAFKNRGDGPRLRSYRAAGCAHCATYTRRCPVQVPAKLQPAKFREMQLDTHKTLSPDDHPKLPKQQHGKPAHASTSDRIPCAAAKPSKSLQQKVLEKADSAFKSAFRPKPEHGHVVGLAKQHRQLVQGSGWAQLNQLDSALEAQLAQQRRKAKHDMQGA